MPIEELRLGVEHPRHNFIANGVIVHNKLPVVDLPDGACAYECDSLAEFDCPEGEKCQGRFKEPQCTEDAFCLVVNDGIAGLCAPAWDPQESWCGDGLVCMHEGPDGTWVCVPDELP